jgi:predicted ester cyclase
MALVRRFMEAQAKGDLDTLDELLAPDFVDHSSFAGQEPGREGYMQQVAEQIAALSEVRCIIEDQLAKGEKVVTRITWRSIHDRGEYFGLMPRDKEVEVTSMTMHRIVRGKITEEWSEGSGSAEVAQAHLEQEVRKRERVEHDLSVARSIQQASLPKEVPTLEGWQISPYYQPAREVGGDFYDFHLLPEGRLGLVVGMQRARGCQQRSLCPRPVACCASQPRAIPRQPRCSRESTRCSFPTSLPTCSSPASTPSSSPTADVSATPMPGTTFLTYTVTVRPRN